MAETTTTEVPAATPRLLGARLRLAARPETFAEQLLNSSVVWLALMAYWAVADLVHGAFPSVGRQVPPDGWLTHLALTLLGLAAIWCMHRSGFPAAWDERIPARRRLLIPLVAGALGYGWRCSPPSSGAWPASPSSL